MIEAMPADDSAMYCNIILVGWLFVWLLVFFLCRRLFFVGIFHVFPSCCQARLEATAIACHVHRGPTLCKFNVSSPNKNGGHDLVLTWLIWINLIPVLS